MVQSPPYYRQDCPGGEEGWRGGDNQGSLSTAAVTPQSRKRTGTGYLRPVKLDTITNARVLMNPPAMSADMDITLNGVPEKLRIQRWAPAKNGAEYVTVMLYERKWNLDDPAELQAAILNGLHQSKPCWWTLSELQRRLGHGMTVDRLRPAIIALEKAGALHVVRGKPRKNSLSFMLVRP